MIITIIVTILTITLAIYLFCGVAMTIKEDISSYKEEKNLRERENYLQDLEAARKGKLI